MKFQPQSRGVRLVRPVSAHCRVGGFCACWGTAARVVWGSVLVATLVHLIRPASAGIDGDGRESKPNKISDVSDSDVLHFQSSRSLLAATGGVTSANATTSEELHAALADPEVTEVRITGALEISARVFGLGSGKRLVIDRAVTLRGVDADAALLMENDDKGKRAVETGWLEYSQRLSFISLDLRGVVVLWPPESTVSLYLTGLAGIVSISGSKRRFVMTSPDLKGEMYFRNCTMNLEPDEGSGDPLDRDRIEQQAVAFGTVHTTTSSAGDVLTPASSVVLAETSETTTFLTDSELRMGYMEAASVLMANIMAAQYGNPSSSLLQLWGHKHLYMLWFYVRGLYVFDCRLSVDGDRWQPAMTLIAEVLSPKESFWLTPEADGFRTAVLSGGYKGDKHSTCQSIYQMDKTWAAEAERTGVQLPPSFSRGILGRDYTGNVNVTRTGRPCLSWSDIDLPGAKQEFYSDLEGNACRNPSAPPTGQRGVWCFVDSAESTWRGGWPDINQTMLYEDRFGGKDKWSQYDWEYCDVPICGEDGEPEEAPYDEEAFPSCVPAEMKEGARSGAPWNITVAEDGEACLNWSEILPYRNLYGRFNDTYCRNPEVLDGYWDLMREPWCWTGTSLKPSRCKVTVCEGSSTPTSLFPNDFLDDLMGLKNPAADRGDVDDEDEDDKVEGGDEDETTVGIAKLDTGATAAIIGAAALFVLISVSVLVIAVVFSKRAREKLLRIPVTEIKPEEVPETLFEESNTNIALSVDACAVYGEVPSPDGSSRGRHALKGKAVEVVWDDPDKLGLVILKGYLGHGITSKVMHCMWKGSDSCCKIIQFQKMEPALADKVLLGVEANLLASLCHPNIVQTFKIYHVMSREIDILHGSVTEQSNRKLLQSVWLIQELCRGGSLKSRLKEIAVKPGALPTFLVLARQVALALQFLHEEMGLVHGDLRPDNIVLKPDLSHQGGYLAKVADFGLAHDMQGREAYSVDRVHGDLYYMAPESAFGHVVSPAMDIWAIGMLVYEMLTGGVSGSDLKTHVKRLYSGFMLDLPDTMPKCVQQFLYNCLTEAPEQRPSARKVVQDLENIIQTLGFSFQPIPPILSSFRDIPKKVRDAFKSQQEDRQRDAYLIPRVQEPHGYSSANPLLPSQPVPTAHVATSPYCTTSAVLPYSNADDFREDNNRDVDDDLSGYVPIPANNDKPLQ